MRTHAVRSCAGGMACQPQSETSQETTGECIVNRTTLVLITAAGLAATGAAQATDVDIYGQARLHLNYIDNGASGDDAYSAASVSTNASVLGFRAEHELSDRLTGIVQSRDRSI